jgi:hypothetical protein
MMVVWRSMWMGGRRLMDIWPIIKDRLQVSNMSGAMLSRVGRIHASRRSADNVRKWYRVSVWVKL